jgi:FixJ family two-component response regulator
MVEDDPLDAELVLRELRRAGLEVDAKRVETEEDFERALEEKPDLILSDYNLPAFDGLRALEVLKSKGADIPFIIISGKIGEELAVRAMKEGAADYLIKDRLARLGESVRQTLKQHRLRIEHERSEAEREQLEQQLRRAEKLELVGRVVTGVAHDINNLLSTMTSYPEIIRSELGSDHPMSDLAAAIEEAANRASNLTRHLLAFSSSREGESMLLDVNQVASDLEKILRRVITDTIDLQLELDPNHGRFHPCGTDSHESGGQCPRCHARRRTHPDRDEKSVRGRGRRSPGGICHAGSDRHRTWNPGGYGTKDLRPVFHHQRKQRRHGTGVGHVPADCEELRRMHQGGERAREGLHFSGLFPGSKDRPGQSRGRTPDGRTAALSKGSRVRNAQSV